MEALTVLKERRSIRTYLDKAVEPEKLEAVLEAGTFAPTGSGKQSPVMVATQNPALVEKLSKLNAAVMGKDTDPFYGAKTVVIVFGNPDGARTWFEDGCLVMGNLMNAAYAVGLDSCWIHRAKEVFAGEEGKALMKEWGVPETYVGIGHCILGYAACEHPAPAPRKEGYVIRV